MGWRSHLSFPPMNHPVLHALDGEPGCARAWHEACFIASICMQAALLQALQRSPCTFCSITSAQPLTHAETHQLALCPACWLHGEHCKVGKCGLSWALQFILLSRHALALILQPCPPVWRGVAARCVDTPLRQLCGPKHWLPDRRLVLAPPNTF